MRLADVSVNGDRLADLLLSGRFVPGLMQHVGQIAAQGGFIMSVAVPLARPGFLTGTVLGFAHTVGEFGVVLMIGGNIPGETKVLSVAIYDYVESLQWAHAHLLAGGMLAFSFVVILAMYVLEKRVGRVGL